MQIRSYDLLHDTQMDTIDGKKVLRIENESGQSTKLNLGDQISYSDANHIPRSLLDDGGVSWQNAGTRSYENKDYTVYSYSHNGHTAEVWVYGNIEVL